MAREAFIEYTGFCEQPLLPTRPYYSLCGILRLYVRTEVLEQLCSFGGLCVG